jgi:hypothetical protein
MDTDEGETNTLDEDIVDLGVHEDVVDKQLANVDVRNWGRVGSGRVIRSRVSDVLKNLVGVSHGHVNKALSVRDGYGRNGETRILVKPEQEGHPEVKLRLNGLRGLRTGVDLNLLAHTSATSETGVHETVIGQLLSHVAVPADALIRRDEELLVHIVHIRVILIKGITIDGELNILDKGLSEEVNITEITVGVIGVIGSNSAELDMKNHIMEEIPKLWDRKLYILSQGGGSGLDPYFIVLIPDSSEGLEMGVHEENMGSLNVNKGRGRILDLGVTRAHALNVDKTLVQQLGSHQHAILLAVIRDSLIPKIFFRLKGSYLWLL